MTLNANGLAPETATPTHRGPAAGDRAEPPLQLDGDHPSAPAVDLVEQARLRAHRAARLWRTASLEAEQLLTETATRQEEVAALLQARAEAVAQAERAMAHRSVGSDAEMRASEASPGPHETSVLEQARAALLETAQDEARQQAEYLIKQAEAASQRAVAAIHERLRSEARTQAVYVNQRSAVADKSELAASAERHRAPVGLDPSPYLEDLADQKPPDPPHALGPEQVVEGRRSDRDAIAAVLADAIAEAQRVSSEILAEARAQTRDETAAMLAEAVVEAERVSAEILVEARTQAREETAAVLDRVAARSDELKAALWDQTVAEAERRARSTAV